MARVSEVRTGPVAPSADAIGRLQPLGLVDVVLDGQSQLGDWQGRNSSKTVPHCIEQVKVSGALRNLARVAGGDYAKQAHEGMHFSDSDVYKVLEAVAWDRARGPSEAASFATETAELLAAAQRSDGYLNSWFQGQHPELAWKDLRWGHELYCAGHLLQAAVASHRVGNGQALSDVAARLLDHLAATFSVEEGDKGLVGVCGHPEVETALVEYYRETGDGRALALARRQIDLRGRPGTALPISGLIGDNRFPLSYFLHHMPVRERTVATGHAVRELYLQMGAVDVAVETSDEQLLSASEAIWDDLYSSKTYVTGGHGSRHRDESIGDAYELPSDRAYAETCAAIASFQWNWRLLLATGRPRYAEAMEHVLWNTIAGAVSPRGTEFFYSNTLHLRSGHDGSDEDSPRQRLPWYSCACCPPNLARLVAAVQAYLVTRDGSGLQVQMPFSGTVTTPVPGGGAQLRVESEHPWGARTRVEVLDCTSAASWELSLRRPQWAKPQGARATLNGSPLDLPSEGGYLRASRAWAPGDVMEIDVGMPIRALKPQQRVDAVRGCVALQRGPLVYCIEGEDLSPGTIIEDITLADETTVAESREVPAELEGYVQVTLRATGSRAHATDRPLYADDAGAYIQGAPLELTFVPYFARCSRPSPSMRVWVPLAVPGSATASTTNTGMTS